MCRLPDTFPPVRNLALQYPRSALHDGPLLVYLTARDRGRGEAALRLLLTDGQLKSAKALAHDGGPTDVKYCQLDTSDGNSIDSFCAFLRKEHPEGIDVLVNNAGVALDGFGTIFASPAARIEKHMYGSQYADPKLSRRFSGPEDAPVQLLWHSTNDPVYAPTTQTCLHEQDCEHIVYGREA
jgi:hypothetical protein